MTVDPTDKFLVNRSGSSYHVDQQDLMAQLEDDDLLLVNRNFKSYKITGAEFKGSLSSPPIIQSVTLTEDDPEGARFTSQDFTTTAVMLDNGNPDSTKSIRGWVEGSLSSTIETDEITAVDISSAPTYSDLVSGTSVSGGGFEKWFDGDTSQSTRAVDGSSATFTYTFPFDVTSLRVWTYGAANLESQHGGLEVNGIPQSGMPGKDWFTPAVSFPFNTLTIKTTSVNTNAVTGLGAIEVNGGLLIDGEFQTSLTLASDKDLAKLQPGDEICQNNAVDGKPCGIVGSVDTDTNTISLSSSTAGSHGQTFSAGGTENFTPGDVKEGWEGMFDGDFSTRLYVDTSSNAEVFTVVFNPPFNNVTSLTQRCSGTGGRITANGNSTVVTPTAIDWGSNSIIDIKSALGGSTTLSSLSYTAGAVDASFGQIFVNGVELIDGLNWSPNTGNYAIGPSTIIDNSKKYLNLDASLNVIGLTDDDSYTRIPGNTLTSKISFPATLDNGEAPDDALPAGTCIQTEVIASNVAGSDTKSSLCITPIESIGPNATMHGLRFDNNRATELKRSGSQLGNTFTLSYWIKPTDVTNPIDAGNDYNIHHTLADAPGPWVGTKAGKWHLYSVGDNDHVTSATDAVLNEWQHVVLKVSNSIGSLHVNGVPISGLQAVNMRPQVGGHIIANNVSSKSYYTRGYMSDVFLIEDQALEPETFGDFFEGKWGPLNSSVVKSNIETAKSEAFPDDQYNRDYVWSSSVTTDAALNSSYPLNQMFDGDEVTFASTTPTNSGGVVDFGTKFPASSGPYDVEVFKVSETSALTINGAGPSRVGAEAAYNYWDGISSIPDITWDNAGSFGARYIKVNGRILVDAGFGANSFYLPFDPAATSSSITYDYEGNTSSSTFGNALDPKIDVPALFNGIVNPIDPDGAGLASGYHSKVDGANQASGSTITFNPGIPIPPGATVGIWGAEQGNYQGILVNGKSQAGYDTSYSAQLVDWTATLAGDTEITSISCTIANNPGEVSAISGIVINGYLLGGNYNNIGVDASGNGNDFTDQGFAVGNSDDWQSGLSTTGTFVTFLTGGGTVYNHPYGLFDNNPDTSLSAGVGVPYDWEPSGGLSYSSSVAVQSSTHTSGLQCNVSLNDGSNVLVTDGEIKTIATGSGVINKITVTPNASQNPFITTIFVDGVALVQSGVQDTVLDTPMNSYAVLETGANGNLEATATGTNVTYMGDAGTDYYYEVDGTGAIHTGGTAFSSASGKTYNFGQQPFANQFDTSEIWSSQPNDVVDVQNRLMEI